MKQKIYIKGFTIVELIVVVTVLLILTTIAFISFQSYTKNSRDSNRLSTMKSIENGISLNQVKIGSTIMPDDYTQVLASGSLLGYEGIVGDNVSRGIQMNNTPKDPIRGENYIYYTNKDRDKVQVMGFLEGEDLAFIGVGSANAAGNSIKLPKVIGDRLGILLDGNNNRVTGTNVDILLTNSGTIYTTYFSNVDTLTSSGKDLYSKVYNRREDLLKDTSLASLDDSLVGYWDMETTTLSGGLTVLKDLSKYSNNGTLSGGIIIGTEDGLKGKSTYFDGVNDKIIIKNSSSLTFSGELTIIAQISPINNYNPNVAASDFQAIIDKGWAASFSMLIHNPTSALAGYYNNNNNTLRQPNIINFNNYNFISYTFKPNSAKLFQNGKAVKEINPGMGIANNSLDLIIGSTAYNSYNFYGLIDTIRIYNRALSDLEISELYNSKK